MDQICSCKEKKLSEFINEWRKRMIIDGDRRELCWRLSG